MYYSSVADNRPHYGISFIDLGGNAPTPAQRYVGYWKRIILKNQFKSNNLKLRSLPEQEEGTSDIKTCLAIWLVQQINLEEEVTLVQQKYNMTKPQEIY